MTRLTFAVVVWAGAVLAALGLATVVSSSVHDQQVAAKRKAAKVVRSAHDVGSGAQARREGGVGTEPPRPRDAAAVGPSSPRSLFRAQNLTVALAALRGALRANADLSAFDLYPSEADAIVADAGARRIVRVDVDGDVRQGRREDFSGSLQVIYLWQIQPGVPQSLARQIARRGRVPTRRLDRMVVDTTQAGNLAGWTIYPRESTRRFTALLTGGALAEEGPDGRKPL
jgi:hypothetical protein